jgi:hypothetical protein
MCEENTPCGSFDLKHRELREKRIEILSKLKNGGEKYYTHAVYQRVIDSLIRGADPILIIEQLMDIIISQQTALTANYSREPVCINLPEEQVNDLLNKMKSKP